MRPLLLVLPALALLAGCGGSSSPSGGTGVGTATGPADDQAFTIRGTDRLQFDPQTVDAKVGTLTLTLHNGGVPHDLKFADPSLPSIPVVSGDRTASATLHFTRPGTYTFVCTIHAGMTGKVVVSS
jgi:plastocyanin